jgi:hypothetical protein
MDGNRFGVRIRSGHIDYDGFGGRDRYIVLDIPLDRVPAGSHAVGIIALI